MLVPDLLFLGLFLTFFLDVSRGKNCFCNVFRRVVNFQSASLRASSLF